MNLYLFTQGYSGEQLYQKLLKRGIQATVYTYAADATRKTGDKDYLRDGFPIRYINERSYDPQLIELGKGDLVICFDWTKDFFHNVSTPGPVYHIHPSLLPLFRGYGAVSEQFLRGTAISGVTLYADNGQVDAGGILFQEEIRIEHHHYPLDFLNTVTDIAARWISELLSGHVPNIVEQDDEQSFYVQRRRQKQGLIDWNAGALYVYNTIRAYSAPYFGSFYIDNGVKTTIWRAGCEKWSGIHGKAGEVIAQTEDSIEIACGEGTVIIYK